MLQLYVVLLKRKVGNFVRLKLNENKKSQYFISDNYPSQLGIYIIIIKNIVSGGEGILIETEKNTALFLATVLLPKEVDSNLNMPWT